MFRLLLKIIVGIIQIPLTILYFVLSFIGGVLAGSGWIIGTIILVITGICWLFGQFSFWYQPVIGIMVAGGVAFLPTFVTDIGGSIILKVKGALQSVV